MAYLVSMRRNPIVGLAFTLLLLGVALPSEGAAQEFADGAITVIQPKPVLRRQRHDRESEEAGAAERAERTTTLSQQATHGPPRHWPPSPSAS